MIKLNGHVITPTIFPDKTSQVWKIEKSWVGYPGHEHIDWDFENEAEFIHVAQLVDLLRSFHKEATINLHRNGNLL